MREYRPRPGDRSRVHLLLSLGVNLTFPLLSESPAYRVKVETTRLDRRTAVKRVNNYFSGPNDSTSRGGRTFEIFL